jgi:drug/metabolite transporter (DMT)-like permease
VHAWSFIAAVFLWAAILATPWCVATSRDLGGMHGVDWLWLLLLVVGPGVVGHGFITWAHRYIDVSLTSLIALGNPVISTVGAWVAFGQSLQPMQIAGVVVVLLALGMLIRAQHAVAAAAEAAVTQDLLGTAE